jgi:proline iminopeptidase
MAQLADDATALADHLGHDTFIVLGHSYGGFVAQELAIRHPHRIDALLLVDTTPGQLGVDEQPGEAQGPPPPPELIEMFSSVPTTDDEMKLLMRAVAPHYVHRVDPAGLADTFDAVIYNAAAAARGFEVLAGWSSVDRLREVRCPTLISVGRFDVITSWPQAERMASRISGARVVIFEDSGHMPWIDEPDMFFDTIAAWLDRFVLRQHRKRVASTR